MRGSKKKIRGGGIEDYLCLPGGGPRPIFAIVTMQI